MTTFLRFFDAPTGLAALHTAGLLDADGNPITASHTHALDVIGPISLPGTYDPETGDELTPPVPLDGWHCNYVGELPEGWEEFVVTPEQPVRVFAGDSGAPAPVDARPINPPRYTRHTDPGGTTWIYDQPRNADGTYASDDPDTELVESALGWHLCADSWTDAS